PYQFQDDPYLSPRTSVEFKLFSLSQESGRAAAKYFVNSNPKLFTKDFAEPHIPCLMPESVALRLEEVSQEALEERISLRKVSAAVEMYDQLLQSGTAVSMETTHKLLDLICLYCDRDPVQEGTPQTEDRDLQPAAGERRAVLLRSDQRHGEGNASLTFVLLNKRLQRSFIVYVSPQHGAYAKAFNLYEDLLNNRLSGEDQDTQRAGSSTFLISEQLKEELLNQMNEQKVRPNLLTFNSVLKALRQCSFLAKTFSPQILNEMKALGIAPSLATYEHILTVFFYKSGSNMAILQDVLMELEGTSFTCQDPNDGEPRCLDNKDLELGYKVHSLVEVGENWRLLGDSYQQALYYGRFFNLLCLMEHIDVVLKWYSRIVPSVSLLYPNPQGMKNLLQALDTDSRLDLLPTIWKDIKSLGHDNKVDLVEELLCLMARDEHSAEVCFRPSLIHVFSCPIQKKLVGLTENKDMLQLFKDKNRVPSGALLSSFLTACRCSASPQRAVELVQLSAAFSLPTTPELAKRTLAEFELNDKQR
uniref:Small ribosomal subunit protein mS39 n=1 Tax=Poecilia mexicana TaxID=48701 RepID=A0A3B3WRD8_9TELE